MINKKYKGVWFYGISGSGKTQASKYLKKEIKNSIILDGDQVRRFISFDLGYSVKDRKVQIRRMLGIGKICIKSKIFPILSTVYMNTNLKTKLKKEKILLICVLRDFKKIKNRKRIYNTKMKDVVGVDIKVPRISGKFILENNNSIKKLNLKLRKIIHG